MRSTTVRGVFPTLTLVSLAVAGPTVASDSDGRPDRGRAFRVTITNITRGQQFTPLLLVSHRPGVRLFTEGSPASAELAVLAEEGDTAPLTARLSASRGVLDVTTAGPLLDPGASRTVTVRTRGDFDHLSLAAMLIPTNDGFVALNDVAGPHGSGRIVLYARAYDAGSEVNDELCASIPGPSFVECGGPGGGAMPAGGEEGFVHIHAGIHGIGDLTEAQRDWRNPVARVVIESLP